ncbi:MAG: hypothetical protein ISN29_12470, partial [Gammaproteobacteria bacterium AqS3]|nr:hypothetical protein [Gammaproteobacteria bacterium AqS3]
MAQISWPRRKIRITRETVANTFSVRDERDRNAVGLYDEVYVDVTDNNWHQSGATPHYIQPAAKAGHFELSESEYGGTAVSLPGNNTIW